MNIENIAQNGQKNGILDRFYARIQPEPNSGCWIWTGTSNRGRALFCVSKGKYIKASRLSWKLYKGEIPDGLCACHKCDTTLCVNPNHLFLGTQLENIRDRDIKRRHAAHRQGSCKHGHALVGDNLRISSTTGERICRTCIRARKKIYRERAKIESLGA